ncbi:MAG: ATP-binding protein [Kyrpidia sp.]|nr:ATP-binding protein [Kyrpidia sp.]
MLTKQWSADEIMREMFPRSNNPVWRENQREVQEYLRYFLPFHRVNLIVVPLNRRRITIDVTADNWKDWFRQAATGILDVRNRFLRNHEEISEDQLEAARKATEEWKAKLAPMVRLEKASLRDIEWWLKKGYYRGLSEPKMVLPDPHPVQVVARGGKAWLRPSRAVYLALTDVLVPESGTHLVVKHPHGGESHQTFFFTVSVPQPVPEDDPTGFEWLYGVLENTSFPVDVALHVLVEPAHEAIQHLRKKKKTAEAQYKEWVENDEDVPIEPEEDMASVASLERKLRSRQPLVHVTTIFDLGAAKPEKLRQRVEQFQQTAGTYHTLVRAPGDMKKMLQAFYPFGEDLPTGWEFPMDPGVLGAAVPFGTRALGDPAGFWLVRLFNGRPVWMDPRRPVHVLNTTSATLLAGTLGSGKSYLLKYLVTTLLSWGGERVHGGPEGRDGTVLDLPFDAHMMRFTYDSGTSFSPFRVGNTQDARAIMELIFNPLGDDRRQVVLNHGVERVLKGEKWDMRAFYEAMRDIAENSPDLRDQDEARLIAERVRLMADHEIGRLFFGEDTGESVFDHDLVIAVVRGLSLPDKSVPKEKWTETERYSAAILYAVATLGLRRLLALPKSMVKVLAIDEAWVLRRFEQG